MKMMKKHLLFGSVTSVALIVLLLVSAFSGSGSVETAGANSPAGDSSSMIDAPTQTRQVSFTGPGKVAVFDVAVSGSGVLMVDCADWNPTNYKDYWRTSIMVKRLSGLGSWAVVGVVASACADSGTGDWDWGPYRSRSSQVVVYNLRYIVHVSYEYGCDTWNAGCLIRFRYTGPAISIAGPRDGF